MRQSTADCYGRQREDDRKVVTFALDRAPVSRFQQQAALLFNSGFVSLPHTLIGSGEASLHDSIPNSIIIAYDVGVCRERTVIMD
jgi:hypothetical protein